MCISRSFFWLVDSFPTLFLVPVPQSPSPFFFHRSCSFGPSSTFSRSPFFRVFCRLAPAACLSNSKYPLFFKGPPLWPLLLWNYVCFNFPFFSNRPVLLLFCYTLFFPFAAPALSPSLPMPRLRCFPTASILRFLRPVSRPHFLFKPF